MFARINAARDAGDTWCTEEKAHALAALVVALRPSLVVELGVWRGASLLPMLFALEHVERGRAVAIDPWQTAASIAGETSANAEWWSKAVGETGHEAAYGDFISRVKRWELAHRCSVIRARSDDVDASTLQGIGLLHIDGNHSDQAVRDVERFGPSVIASGIVVFDDVAWEGGHVERAKTISMRMGFRELYTLGTGCVMQRRA